MEHTIDPTLYQSPPMLSEQERAQRSQLVLIIESDLEQKGIDLNARERVVCKAFKDGLLTTAEFELLIATPPTLH